MHFPCKPFSNMINRLSLLKKYCYWNVILFILIESFNRFLPTIIHVLDLKRWQNIVSGVLLKTMLLHLYFNTGPLCSISCLYYTSFIHIEYFLSLYNAVLMWNNILYISVRYLRTESLKKIYIYISCEQKLENFIQLTLLYFRSE